MSPFVKGVLVGVVGTFVVSFVIVKVR